MSVKNAMAAAMMTVPLLLLFAVATARGEEAARATPVTDAESLASIGFPSGARNIYAIREQLNQPLEGLAGPQDYYGGTASGFSTYLGNRFLPLSAPSTPLWNTQFGMGDINVTLGAVDARLEVQLDDIPNGARLQALRWWASDTHTISDLVFAVHQVCQPHLGPGPAVLTVLATSSTLGSAGDQSGEMTINSTVDMKACAYKVRATLDGVGPALTLYKVRAQWVRQVSPAPATARFLDVPSNHPFFRFVEALAASGITGGCSANQYCPDNAVTRGQMAVFLATALGLNWGGL